MSGSHARLKKNLTLFDVYAISTGAMFSSGFFLLPGIAFAHTGRSIVLAYLLSGLLILPAMLSQAELATAMPRAGGTYFFLDRAFGPMVGTVGGLGTWFAMVLKTAFALVGIGAYLGLLLHLDITTLALALTGVFLVINVVGARESSLVQRVLVAVLVAILALFMGAGLHHLSRLPGIEPSAGPATDFLAEGVAGLLSTIGLVFVSYAGLTNVASVAEEVQNPDRNIPLGMALSLATATLVYAVGAYLMVALLDPVRLGAPDLTPVASASEIIFAWLPGRVGLFMIVTAAIAAFASTGNAGVLSASRYLLALARDRRIPEVLARLGRFRTPTWTIVASSAAIVLCLVTLDVEGLAKLASAFQLLIFSLVNLAVIAMRESRVHSYVPGFRAPLYPWMPIVGAVAPVVLIAEMGHLAIIFTTGVVAACLGWYFVYVRADVDRGGGAVYHALARFVRSHTEAAERLSTRLEDLRSDEVDVELRGILQERGLHEQDHYDEVVARAFTMEADPARSYREIALEAARLLAERIPVDAEQIADGLMADRPLGMGRGGTGVALPHVRLERAGSPQLVLARCREGLRIEAPEQAADGVDAPLYHAIIFLVSPAGSPSQHLRILAHIALCLDSESFMADWLAAGQPQELRETLFQHERVLSLRLERGRAAESLIGERVQDLTLPEATLLAAIRRRDEVLFPRGYTRLEEHDRVTIVGRPEAIEELYHRFVRPD